MDARELNRLLSELRRGSDDDLRARFARSLPFADALFDRWERARRLGFGPDASVYDSASVFGDVSVGAKTWIGPNVLLDGSAGPLKIGPHCSISAAVHIYTHDTVLWAVSGGALGKRTGGVAIGANCHIGAQSVVLPGVTVGDRCVIAANSLVNRDVPESAIVAGSPARRIGRVEGSGAATQLVMDRASDEAAKD